MFLVVMGVAGSGKTTLGQALGQRLGWEFRDADGFHPAANIAKMKAGTPLKTKTAGLGCARFAATWNPNRRPAAAGSLPAPP